MGAPYDKLEAETKQAFEAFVRYRDMGVDRSNAAVARTLGKSKTMMDRWSSKHRWVKRSAAWDSHVDLHTRNAELKALEQMRANQVRSSTLLQKVGERELQKLEKKALKRGVALEPIDIVRFIKEGSILERLNRGEPGEIQQQMSETDLSKLDPQDLRDMKRIKRKMGMG